MSAEPKPAEPKPKDGLSWDVMFQWCGQCLQGVERVTWTTHPGVYLFEPCGHIARFYEPRP